MDGDDTADDTRTQVLVDDRLVALERRVRRLRRLVRLGRLVSPSLGAETILAEIAAEAAAVMDAPAVAVWSADPVTRTLEARAFSDPRLAADFPIRRLSFDEGGVGWVATHRRPLRVDDVFADSRFVALDWWSRHGLSTFYAVPVVLDEALLAVLALNGHAAFRPTADDEEHLESLVAQAAVAIRNARLFAEIGARRQTAEALAEIGRLLSEALDPGAVALTVVDSVCRLLAARSAAIYRVEPDTGALVAETISSGVGETFYWTPQLEAGTGLVALALREERPVTSTDVLADPRLHYSAETRRRIADATHRALLAVPLVAKERVFGALAVGDRTGRCFTDDDMALGRTFATQAAIALENARLFEDVERRRQAAEELARTSRVLTESLDVRQVSTRIVASALRLLGAQSAVVRLAQTDGTLVVAAVVGPTALHIPVGHAVPAGLGAGGRAVERRHPVVSPNLLADPELTLTDDMRVAIAQAGEGACLAVPLLVEGAATGALLVLDRPGRVFSRAEVALLQALADQAALAIRNGRLVERLRAQQIRLGGLLEASAELARIQPVPALLETMAAACGRLLEATAVGFRTVEGDQLVARATWGEAAEVMTPACTRLGEGLGGSVAALGTLLRVAGLLDDAHVLESQRTAIRQRGFLGWLGVPVRVGERVLGVLELWTRRPAGFGEEDAEVATVFAAQAATALENARLYQETQRALNDLSETQHQLGQAQKMDAIGRLAGGVAHDFNNILTVVQGRAEILARRARGDERLLRDLGVIQQATTRAVALTNQLLAFSRRQVLQARVLDLDALVTSFSTMLKPLVGEHIELVVAPGDARGRVKADPGQIEQVLLNLAINARDAMPEGGTLTIETADVELDDDFVQHHPGARIGPHVVLSVQDTGCGMDAETRRHAFEPFFTTKDRGKGTGLGLATVYGIVKQHGGYVGVDSEPGRGTRFDIYLPGTTERETPLVSTADGPSDLDGCETILLAEDEAEVRQLAAEILAAHGYAVLEATDGAQALELCTRHPGPIHLLLTDVIMPRMSGPELARQLAASHPRTPVLFLSGYTDEALGRHGVLEPGVTLLAKPFTPDALLQGVRTALDAPDASC